MHSVCVIFHQALEINRHDAWATHALAHVYEMTGQHEKGIQFMTSTESDWKVTPIQVEKTEVAVYKDKNASVMAFEGDCLQETFDYQES